MTTIDEAKELICQMCASFYTQGWVSGSGGGMSIRAGEAIVMAPSGVPKERMQPRDMFVLDAAGEITETPSGRPAPYKAPKLSECAPLFMSAYQLRGAGAVIHSHSVNAVLATMLDENASEFRITQLEMIKGIAGHGFYDDLVIPIIQNTARECELTDHLQVAIRAHPRSSAVLVRRHGIYVWGPTWVAAKTQAECYDYLFESAIKLRQLGIDTAVAPKPTAMKANGHADTHSTEPAAKRAKRAAKPTAIVLDIEGTVAPISFVVEVLFPYAKARLRSHLEATFDRPPTQQVIHLFREQGGTSAAQAVQDGKAAVPAAGSSAAEVVAAVVALAEGDMAADRKSTALKALQGHIWHGGFQDGQLVAQMYPDVAPALGSWAAARIKVYIYSSGSSAQGRRRWGDMAAMVGARRAAQRDLFGHTAEGDLRHHLSGFFDTTSGAKAEKASYDNIALSLGVDAPEELLFATDSIEEAEAAVAAGWQVALTVREGNKPLPDSGLPTSRVIRSMDELL